MKKNLKQLGIGLVCSFAALATTAVAQTTDSQSQFGDLIAQQAGPQRGGQNQRGFGGPQGGQRGMMRGMQRDVLRIKEVQEHLKLSKEQIDKIMTWRPEGAPEGPPQGGRGGFGGGQGQGQGRGGFGGGQQGGQAGPPQGRGGFGQNQEQMEKMRKEREKFILSVIGQQKFDRYQELQLQFDGISAVNRPDIAKELGLTAAQKNKIQEIMEKYRPNRGGQGGPPEGGRGGFGGGQGQGQGGGQGRGGFGGGQQGGQAGPPQGGMNPNQMKAMREKMEKEIRTVLTAAQQNKWDVMLGAKFTFPENAFRQGPPPGGQGGPPQGGRGGFGGGQGGRTGGGGGGEIL